MELVFPIRDLNDHPGSLGMTLRDYFAAKALGQFAPWNFAADTEHLPEYVNNIARTAYAVADAMLKARQA